MDKYTVLLAEDKRNAQPGLEDLLRAHPDINFLPPACDGLKAVESLTKNNVDLLLLDLVLAEIDGIGVLKMISDFDRKPTIILVTALSSPLIINQAAKLGAVHTLLKPGDPQHILNRVLEIYQDASAMVMTVNNKSLYVSEVQKIIVETLHEIGIPPQLLGYEYLRIAILETLKGDGRVSGITTQLYPQIAQACNSTPAKIERSIRHAIETTWNRTARSTFQNMLRYGMAEETSRPTNSEFIALITNYVSTQLQKIG